MSQDTFTLIKNAKELNELLINCKINKVTQPTPLEINLILYEKKSYCLIISANPEEARVHITSQKSKENPLACPNFCMLLRKHLVGGEIKGVFLDNSDRVIKIVISSKNDLKDQLEKILYVEIMGKYSNIILTENGVILGSLKSCSIEENSKRPLLVGIKYLPPPPQDKVDIFNRTEIEKLFSTFNGEETPSFLFNNVKGLAFSTAEFIAKNIFDGKNLVVEKFYSFLDNYINGEINPNVVSINGKEVDFFPIDFTYIQGDKKFFETLSEAQDFFYFEKSSKRIFENKKHSLFASINQEKTKIEKKLGIILNKFKDIENREENRLKGELLTSNIYRLKNGASSVCLENYNDENLSEINISLDKNLSISENAQKYFKKFNKQKKTLLAITPQKEEAELQLNYIHSIINELNFCENLAELLDVEEELILAGLIKQTKIKEKKTKIISSPLIFSYDGYTITCGKNNIQNDRVTSLADKNSLWLHVKDFHGSHVVISGKPTFTDEIILISAQIASFYSESRMSDKVNVDFTLRKFVKKQKGATLGAVFYTDQKTILVTPKNHNEYLV